jgi:hypothetical protein
MIVGELYNSRYFLLLVLSVKHLYKTQAFGRVYRVEWILLDGTGRTQYGEFTESDWNHLHTRVV